MPKQSIEAKVRPLVPPSLEKIQGAARLYVSRQSYIDITGGLEGSRHCFVDLLLNGSEPQGQGQVRREASLWVVPEKNLSPNIVMMSRVFQEAAGYKVGDQVRITLSPEIQTPDAQEVVLQEVVQETTKAELVETKYPASWEFFVSNSLDRAEMIFPGMLFEGIIKGKQRRSFKVVSVNSKTTSLARYKLATTTIRILGEDEEVAPEAQETPAGELILSDIPGLTSQVAVVNEFLEGFSRPFLFDGECQSCGFVIHGGPGTGKTFILQHLAETKWGRAFWINPEDKLSTIREVFNQARSGQPSMVFIDGLEEVIDKERSNRDSVIKFIGEELDSLSAARNANGTLPRTLVIATCLDYMTDVPAKLRQLSRFLDNIALPIPRAAERLEILQSLKPSILPEEMDQLLWDVAQKTHAYNRADLKILITKAINCASKRLRSNDDGDLSKESLFLTLEDLTQAFNATRPTAMHDINLRPPTIHWQDVGGQDKLKKTLTQMINLTKNPKRAQRVLRTLPKGALLYGPPGCSKTLSAQAMATESGFNFFAVKGAELLNMYVGESERAVRTLFARARAAAPSIIFFDEIDSIGGDRGGPGSGSSGASRSTGAVNMLTTLLNEMDGFETLSGVLILAATNRPEVIDPALLRPGRFDYVLYVGPPNQEAREAVFQVHLQGLGLAPDVDFKQLAIAAEGYSGAEIKAICGKAGQRVLDRDPDWGSDTDSDICMADLLASLDDTPRNITRQMIDGYEKWAKQCRKS